MAADEAGVAEMQGCPDPDRDGDTVVDRLDNCPDEPGTPENQGCAKRQLVQLTGKKIEILDVVYFRQGRALSQVQFQSVGTPFDPDGVAFLGGEILDRLLVIG